MCKNRKEKRKSKTERKERIEKESERAKIKTVSNETYVETHIRISTSSYSVSNTNLLCCKPTTQTHNKRRRIRNKKKNILRARYDSMLIHGNCLKCGIERVAITTKTKTTVTAAATTISLPPTPT